jgi:hypothetical protein
MMIPYRLLQFGTHHLRLDNVFQPEQESCQPDVADLNDQ